MATFTVTTAADVVNAGDGVLSLREAVQRANASGGEDTIRFAAAVEAQRLVLTQGQLTLTGDVHIDGDRNDDGVAVTIDGDRDGRVLEIANPDDLPGGIETSLEDLTITGGAASEREMGIGGGILLGAGNGLSLSNCIVRDNFAGFSRGTDYTYGAGGGIYAAAGSRLSIVDSSFSHNASVSGGAIRSADAALVIRRSELSSNGGEDGGAISSTGGSLVMEQSVASENYASGSGGTLDLHGVIATIARSTISGNGATFGGGMNIEGGRVALIESTVAANTATFSDLSIVSGTGGGICVTGHLIRGASLSSATARSPATGRPVTPSRQVGAAASISPTTGRPGLRSPTASSPETPSRAAAAPEGPTSRA